MKTVLETAREKLFDLAEEHGLRDESVRAIAGALSPEQAIGNPERRDFALLEGKEVMVQAEFQGHFGQAFTSRPREFAGTLEEALSLEPEKIENRAVLVAVLNAVCSRLGLAERTRHCRNQDMEDCGKRVAAELLERFGRIRVWVVGYQPALLENLAEAFGPEFIRCSDLDPRNIRAEKFGVLLSDGGTAGRVLSDWCDLVLATSSTAVNGTLDGLFQEAADRGKRFIMFGVSGAALEGLAGIERICPLGR